METNYQEALEKGWAAPVAKDTFTFGEDGKPHFVASKCTHCGTAVFPAVLRCPNCFKADMTHTPLATGGELKSFTVVRQGSPDWKGDVPYIIVQVTTDDGVKVSTQLLGCTPEQAEIGMRVTTDIRPLFNDAEDRQVLGPVFIPA